jgi:hypothetical protein
MQIDENASGNRSAVAFRRLRVTISLAFIATAMFEVFPFPL